MGQQLSKVSLEIVDPTKVDDTSLNLNAILPDSDKHDITFFFPSKTAADVTTNSVELNDDHSSFETVSIRQIQNYLSVLTRSSELERIDAQIAEILMGNVLTYVTSCYKKAIEQITDHFQTEQRLQTSLTNKFKKDNYADLSIFAQTFVDLSSESINSLPGETSSDDDQQLTVEKRKARFQAQQVSYFAVQSLSSILLILIKSAEKNDPTIVHQILTLTSQLCEQIPMKYLSLPDNNSFLFKSLKPLTNFVNELSLSNNSILAKQATRILLSFSIAKGSFRDILPILCKLVFNTIDIYDVRGLFIQLNNGLTEAIDQWAKQKQQPENGEDNQSDSDSESGQSEDDHTTSKQTTDEISSVPLDYLKSIGTFPNTKLMEMDEKLFTGQLISSIVLAHLDFDNQINSAQLLQRDTADGSFSFEFHPDTFKQLFHIIEQLSTTTAQPSSTVVVFILTACLRLFTTHLKFLCAVKSNLDRDLLATNEEMRKSVRVSSSESTDGIDLTRFADEDQIEQWFQLLLRLACDEQQKTVCEEASKALLYLIDKQTTSFTQKLTFIHKYIVENQHPILIKQLVIELNKEEILLSWIEVLCNDKSDQTTSLEILYSFIEMENEQIQPFLHLFQQLLLYRLVPLSREDTTDKVQSSTSTSSLVIQYVTQIFKNVKVSIVNGLFNELIVGLCLMTRTNEIFDFSTIQPIFAAVLPLLAQYLLQNTVREDENNRLLISWLIGKMSQVMISGSPKDPLETKHADKLKLVIFAGGCERQAVEKSQNLSGLFESNLALYSRFRMTNEEPQSLPDKDFLMSIYNNVDEGAQLISKMKMFVKNKQRLLQKSIEQQANDACAAVFAVYIKHFRRINLAKYELSRTDQSAPHSQLLSTFQYATNVQTLFATIKAQGGDCDEIYKQIKTKALFLLLSVKESDLIPIIKEDLPQPMTGSPKKKGFDFQRQCSRWSKAKHVIKLLRHLMQACIRFKKLMLAKKQAMEQKLDYESLLHQAIEAVLYGDFNKKTTSTESEENQLELDELEKCLCRQYERAMIRLITYQFIQTFIQKVCDLEDQNRALIILAFYLTYLRNSYTNFSYLENIEASNDQLKGLIRNNYYSIIKTILSNVLRLTTIQSKMLAQNMFHLLNLNYETHDICHLHHHQFAETLFISSVSFLENPERVISLDLKFNAYNWFRLFVFKLCENIQLEELRGTHNQLLQQQRQLVFNTLILNELKGLKQLKETLSNDTEDKTTDSEENRKDSLKNVSIGWFIQAIATGTSKITKKFEIDLCTNQYLVLLLQCVHFYEHVRSICATVDYIQELVDIYHHSEHNATHLLVLKILRQLISYLPESIDGTSNSLIETFLDEILLSIGESFTSQRIVPDTMTELIYLYRTIMSVKSPWQIQATQLVFDSINFNLNLKSIETNDTNQMNKLSASLCVLGGYVQPYSLGAIVKVSANEEMSEDPQLAMIIEIDRNARDLGTPDASPYLIQYLQTNLTESVGVDKLRVEVDVPLPNLCFLPGVNDPNVAIHSFFDTLGSSIQIDTSTTESLMLLQLKRRSVSALYQILHSKKLVELFIQKPYASVIAQLSISDSLPKIRRQPADLRLFNKQHLEQYCLSLDSCERLKQITYQNEDENDDIFYDAMSENAEDDLSYTVWNNVPISPDQLIVDTLSMSIFKYNGWKPYASKAEIQLFKKGRLGNDEVSVVSMPRDIAEIDAVQQCGTMHQFRGRIYPTDDNTNAQFPTFILDNLQLNTGKWYFCVKLPVAGLVQIGWATNGFMPHGSHGVGDDEYSWSYDGSRGVFFNDDGFYGQFDDLRWKENDVCGCGIEIDGENTNIKYWLNGKFLGTAFKHQSNIPLSETKCNLLPNGRTTTYFPGVSLQCYDYIQTCCELIFSPEDMQECPLPHGYKPLLVPKLVNLESSIVAYPYSAYLVGDNVEDYFYTTRTTTSITLLRDFVNEHHLETDLTLDGHHLILSRTSAGFPLSIDNNASSFTITFDFEVSKTVEDDTDDQLEIVLLTIDATEDFSIRIPLKKIDGKTRVVMVFRLKERQTNVYINNECQTLENRFQSETITKFNFHLLPAIDVGIENLAIWKYALPEEQIRRLFTYGLFYVAVDHQQLKEYRKQANTFSFEKQQQFQSELLVPFDQPFEGNIWETKKKRADDDEAKYFNSHDQSNIQFFGNKTYLVLDKSVERWCEYTLILDISIPSWPINNEQLSLVTLNDKSRIFATHDGKLCLQTDEANKESQSKMILNEYFRLFISIEEKCAEIYVNGSLEIDANVDDDQFHATSNRFDLFRETDLTKNTTSEDALRVQCRSITYLNKPTMIDEQMKTPHDSLETLVTLPISIFASSLIAIGYKKEWIQFVIEQYKTTNIQMMDTILREQKQQFLETDRDNERKRYLNILSRLGPSIDQDKLKEDLIDFQKFETDEQVAAVGKLILTHWNDLQITQVLTDTNEMEEDSDEDQEPSLENKWFRRFSHGLNMDSSVTEWIQDKSKAATESDSISKLFDLTQTEGEQTTLAQSQRKNIQKSIQYSHRDISCKQYLDFRIGCELGLTTIYARSTVLNMLKVWSNDATTLFPLEILGDFSLIVKLLRLMDYHNIYTRTHTDENVDQVSLLTNSILKAEMKELVEYIAAQSEIKNDILQSKAPFLSELQKDVVAQSIRLLLDPSLLEENDDDETITDEQTMIKQPNLNFLLKILNIFVELVADKLTMKQNQIDTIISFLFPVPLINLMFDLFLVVPTHLAKIFILHLFATLIQTSKSFHLTDQMHHFLFELLIELSSNTMPTSNRSMKKFQVSVMDLVFLLLAKRKKERIATNASEILNEQQKQELEPDLIKLPQNVRDLFTVIDVIEALTDQTKQKPLPKSFLTQSDVTLGDSLKFNREEFEKCNNQFDVTADQQLINLMNKNPLLNDSFANFILSLPIESIPNSTFYQNYPSLSNIPADCVQIRAKFFCLLNNFVEHIYSMVDFSLSPGQSFLTDQIRTAKIYLLYSTKFQLFNEILEKTQVEEHDDWLIVNFDTVQASISNENNENTMFHQAYQQLHANAHLTFRRQNDQIWHAQYIGMHSSDQGGPYRDSITRICSDICSTRLALFILCPNGRTNSGLNRDCWIPNVFPPDKPIPNKFKKQYRFIGQLMGLAIRKKHYLDIKFPTMLWKHLLREAITIEDIQAIDMQSFTIISEMEKNIDQTKSIDTDTDINYLFSSILSELRFDVVSSAGQTYELVSGGNEIPITAANFKQYCSSYRQYRLNEFHRQIDLIRQGLHSVVPCYFLSLFTAGELEEAVCGKGQIDVELLKRNTHYGSRNNQSPHIQRFWTVLSEMFNDEQKKLFLTFVWGRSTLPSRDEDFQSKFIINPYDVYHGQVDKTLPRSHTCFFTIDLPEYSTTEIMYERLNYAITYCASIDGDGNMNETPETMNFDSDSSSDA